MTNRARLRMHILAVVLPLGTFHGVMASVPTVGECLEASDFIANAAAGRDNGLRRDDFLTRLEADFVSIRAFPPSLRWFVQDADDELFLEAEVRRVFDSPDIPEHHRARFLEACLARLTI